MSTPESISLRAPTALDKPAVMSLRRASRTFLEPWEATPPDGSSPFGPGWFDRFLATSRTDSSHRFVIIAHSLPDAGPRRRPGRGASAATTNISETIVGQISLGGIIRGAFQSCYVGYWIGQPFARKGHMRCALALALDYAFQTLDLHRVEANIVPENEPSKGLVRSFGFEYEGLARRYLRINHQWRDHEHWAMTREMWDELKPQTITRPTSRRKARRPAK